MSSSLANAEEYFGENNHIRSATWAKFETAMKTAAITQAKRVLSRLAQVTDIEAAVSSSPTTGLNPEYAIYEQAFWMLINQPMPNADATFPIAEATDPETDSNARMAQHANISPEALRWLVPGGNITLSRG